MPQQVLVKVAGFTDVERRSPGARFSPSEDRRTSLGYSTPQAADCLLTAFYREPVDSFRLRETLQKTA